MQNYLNNFSIAGLAVNICNIGRGQISTNITNKVSNIAGFLLGSNQQYWICQDEKCNFKIIQSDGQQEHSMHKNFVHIEGIREQFQDQNALYKYFNQNYAKEIIEMLNFQREEVLQNVNQAFDNMSKFFNEISIFYEQQRDIYEAFMSDQVNIRLLKKNENLLPQFFSVVNESEKYISGFIEMKKIVSDIKNNLKNLLEEIYWQISKYGFGQMNESWQDCTQQQMNKQIEQNDDFMIIDKETRTDNIENKQKIEQSDSQNQIFCKNHPGLIAKYQIKEENKCWKCLLDKKPKQWQFPCNNEIISCQQ